MKLRPIAAALLFAVLSLSIFAVRQPQGQDIVDLAANNPQLKTFSALVAKAGLTDTLKGPGPYTVLAPDDSAFDKLKAANPKVFDEISNDPDLLKKVLTYHVIEGKVSSADLTDKEKPKTVEGDTLTVHLKKEKIHFNKAQVVTPDVQASNGIVHVIDTVLLPPGLRKAPASAKTGS